MREFNKYKVVEDLVLEGRDSEISGARAGSK